MNSLIIALIFVHLLLLNLRETKFVIAFFKALVRTESSSNESLTEATMDKYKVIIWNLVQLDCDGSNTL